MHPSKPGSGAAGQGPRNWIGSLSSVGNEDVSGLDPHKSERSEMGVEPNVVVPPCLVRDGVGWLRSTFVFASDMS